MCMIKAFEHVFEGCELGLELRIPRDFGVQGGARRLYRISILVNGLYNNWAIALLFQNTTISFTSYCWTMQ